MYGVRITVVKTEFYPELAKDVDTSVKGQEKFGPCPAFKVGQFFDVENIDSIPAKFCSWAWADIERDVAMILFGATPSRF